VRLTLAPLAFSWNFLEVHVGFEYNLQIRPKRETLKLETFFFSPFAAFLGDLCG
jgi:hypothetical protein